VKEYGFSIIDEVDVLRLNFRIETGKKEPTTVYLPATRFPPDVAWSIQYETRGREALESLKELLGLNVMLSNDDSMYVK
jgi:hypothetical protein